MPPGSGIVIVRRDTYAIVLTAKHVMEGVQDFSVSFAVEPNRQLQVSWTDEIVFGFPDDVDLAVFRVNGQIPRSVAPEDPFTGEFAAGAPLVAWGYPASGNTVCLYEGTLRARGPGVLTLDHYVEPGVSGGPLFFRDAEEGGALKLVGVVVRGDGNRNRGSTEAIDIRQAVTIVSGTTDPAMGGPPIWPDIPLPLEFELKRLPLFTFRQVGAGEFVMGSDRGDERPPRPVTLSAFYITKFEVTVGQYNACVRAGQCMHSGAKLGSAANDYPVVGVSWFEAKTYAAWLLQQLKASPDTPHELRRLLWTGWDVDLPSEEEWEKAARFDGKGQYPWGDKPNQRYANYNTDTLVGVGERKCAECAYGLFDMAGNAREWTRSLKLPYPYAAAKAEDATAAGPRAVRGGSAKRDGVLSAQIVRATNRQELPPREFDQFTGFRLALICRPERMCSWRPAE
jgi:formylglycine-generating enzyme required for sulfatase activity